MKIAQPSKIIQNYFSQLLAFFITKNICKYKTRPRAEQRAVKKILIPFHQHQTPKLFNLSYFGHQSTFEQL